VLTVRYGMNPQTKLRLILVVSVNNLTTLHLSKRYSVLSVPTDMLRGSVCVLVFAVCLYTAQSDPAQPKEDAEQKWSRVSHTYQTFNRISYYRVYNEPRKWSDASKTCANDGSHLLIINSVQEATEVQRYLDSAVETYIIGFHDMFVDRYFQTVQCKYTHCLLQVSAAVIRNDFILEL